MQFHFTVGAPCTHGRQLIRSPAAASSSASSSSSMRACEELCTITEVHYNQVVKTKSHYHQYPSILIVAIHIIQKQDIRPYTRRHTHRKHRPWSVDDSSFFFFFNTCAKFGLVWTVVGPPLYWAWQEGGRDARMPSAARGPSPFILSCSHDLYGTHVGVIAVSRCPTGTTHEEKIHLLLAIPTLLMVYKGMFVVLCCAINTYTCGVVLIIFELTPCQTAITPPPRATET